MKKIINVIFNHLTSITIFVVFTCSVMLTVIQYKWVTIPIIIGSFIVSALFIAFLTFACLYGRYIVDNKKFTGFIGYLKSKS